jgi:hypothetical protein
VYSQTFAKKKKQQQQQQQPTINGLKIILNPQEEEIYIRRQKEEIWMDTMSWPGQGCQKMIIS